jgi:hypothetical protein
MWVSEVVHPLALDCSSTGLGNAWRTMVELWQVVAAHLRIYQELIDKS